MSSLYKLAEVFADANLRRRATEIVLTQPSIGGKHYVLKATFEAISVDPGLSIEPTFSLLPEDADKLMQALWDAGHRPNNGSGSTAEACALKGHIKFAEKITDELLNALRPPRAWVKAPLLTPNDLDI